MDRKQFIGGSDIASIMGLSRFATPLQIWALKTGRLQPKDLSNNEAVELGSELEDFVAKKFEKKTGLKVRRAPKIYSHKTYPHFRCQVDRLVVETGHIHSVDALLEVKTCSAWKAKEWIDEEIPQEYILQVMWQLGITGRNTGHIAVLIGGQAFKYKKIDFDQELFDRMIQSAFLFWKMVQDDVPPMAMGDDNPFMIELYPSEQTEALQLVEELNDSIALLQQTKGSIGELMKTKDDLEAKLKAVIGNNLGIRTKEFTVTWKRMAKKEFVVPASETRILRIRKEKHDDPNTSSEG